MMLPNKSSAHHGQTCVYCLRHALISHLLLLLKLAWCGSSSCASCALYYNRSIILNSSVYAHEHNLRMHQLVTLDTLICIHTSDLSKQTANSKHTNCMQMYIMLILLAYGLVICIALSEHVVVA
jgi:hypothetical protein